MISEISSRADNEHSLQLPLGANQLHPVLAVKTALTSFTDLNITTPALPNHRLPCTMANPTPTAPVSSHTHDLDNLQAMLNMVLVSSGQYIKQHHTTQNPNQIQGAFKRSIMAASERFHDSLDELEAEVLQAQLVLRRDLAVMKADRKKREAAAKEKEAERARLAAESTAQKPAPIDKKEDPPKSPSPPPVKVEPPAKINTPPEPQPESPSLTQKVENPSPTPAPDVKPVPSEDQNDPPAQEATASAAPQDTDDFDFDALFGDTMDTAEGDGENPGDLNLDGSGHDLSFSLDDTGPSLLPGLEDYAKSVGDDTTHNTSAPADLDLPMPDLPDVTTATVNDQPSTTKPAEAPPAQETTDNDLNLEAMTTDNLDDLFDMEFTNPEDSQFDDAFFGLGE
ncbi:unnamed protein product [Periconia digitata]|uniref:Uncharacterized protein n=1 Tax=Periconia digitata TaxID=1303443 RepID=A0A9W4UB70_9PLEO|nr:unnamed protein product [Periconia digitata]